MAWFRSVLFWGMPDKLDDLLERTLVSEEASLHFQLQVRKVQHTKQLWASKVKSFMENVK